MVIITNCLELRVLDSNIFSIRNRYNMVIAMGSNSAAYRLCVFGEVTAPQNLLHLKSGFSNSSIYLLR